MQFDTMKNGYNRYQVDDEIASLKQTIDSLQRQLSAYRKQSEMEQEKLIELRTKYNNLVRDLDIREQAAKDMTNIALSEANDIVKTANDNAEMIVKEALMGAKDILVNITKLGVEAQEVKANLNHQLKLLTAAINEFDVPPLPSPELLKEYDD